jgi:hypothetical protein
MNLHHPTIQKMGVAKKGVWPKMGAAKKWM